MPGLTRAPDNSKSIRLSTGLSTRHRVLNVIGQVGFRPNRAARALVTSRSRTIGVLTSQTAFYGPTTALHTIEQAARKAGYLVSMTSLASSGYDAIIDGHEHFMSKVIEGLVDIAPWLRVLEVVRDLEIGIPLVTLDSTGRDKPRSLSIDQIVRARLATRHLIELGHQVIIHVAGPQDLIETKARMEGFLHEIQDADLRTYPSIPGDWTAEFGHYAGRELARFRDFTAVFAASDQMALRLMHAFREAGLDVPGDVSIVGFDDLPEEAHFWPPLATVHQDFVEIGRHAIVLLLGELGGQRESEGCQILPELIVRSSTAPPTRSPAG